MKKQPWEIFGALREAADSERLIEYIGCDRTYLTVWAREGVNVHPRVRARTAALAVGWGIIQLDDALEWLGLDPDSLAKIRKLPRRKETLGDKLKAICTPDMTPVQLHAAALSAGIKVSLPTVYKLIRSEGIVCRKNPGGNFSRDTEE